MTSPNRRAAILAVLAIALSGGLGVAGAERVNVKAAAKAIMAADRSFNQAVADRDMDRFLSFVAEMATFNGGTPQEIRGREAVGKAWAPFFRVDGPRLTWKPKKAEVLVGGDVGYTIGTWERLPAPGSGQTKIARGNYMTVWNKQDDGSWKVVFDTGSSEP
jgi:ketosteroid isomerase-like protein